MHKILLKINKHVLAFSWNRESSIKSQFDNLYYVLYKYWHEYINLIG